MVSIKGLSKAAVLAALYNASRPQGVGDLTPMQEDEAKELLEKRTYFDYLKGRVMKVNLESDDGFNTRHYDRNNGVGAARRAVERARPESRQ